MWPVFFLYMVLRMRYNGHAFQILLLMRTYFILGCILSGTAAFAADYSNDVNLTGNGGAYAVQSGTSMVVDEDCTYTGLAAADGYAGGAIYVGENASLELKGTHTFDNNVMNAEAVNGSWRGDFNDVYLDNGATLTLNAEEDGDVISLGSGLRSAVGETSVVKKGAGKLIFGERGHNEDMNANLHVESGTVEMLSDVYTTSVRVDAGASIFLDSPDVEELIVLRVGTSDMEEIGFTSGGDGITLSGLVVSAAGISSVSAEKGSISGATVDVCAESRLSVDSITLSDSEIWVDSDLDLSNISMDADSRIDSAAEAVLSGDNYLELAGLESAQLWGVTLADGATLSISLAESLLADQDPENFSIMLEGLTLAENASVTLNVQVEGSADFSVVMSGYTPGDSGLVISLATAPAVPEPTTATLSLLALAGLLARRRRK